MSHSFSQRLLTWYDQHGRKHLPWQKQVNAYRVWVSEIMLQQTQVATVIPYFERFMQRFPDVVTLADANIDEVLHLWTGLGYYARGRNLHKAAQVIRDQHNGEFPLDIEQVVALPGIGRSTAAAILSLAHNQSHAILDGNVKRVLARHRAIDGWPGAPAIEKEMWQLAEQLAPNSRNNAYTQAIMDLGATVCRRSQPLCDICPVRSDCLALAQQRQHELPTPRPKKQIPTRHTTMLMIRNSQGEVLLQQRPPSGIWGGLWCFPQLELDSPDDETILNWCQQHLTPGAQLRERWPSLRHTFSHFHLMIEPVLLELKRPPSNIADHGHEWHRPHEVELGLAAPVKELLQRLPS